MKKPAEEPERDYDVALDDDDMPARWVKEWEEARKLLPDFDPANFKKRRKQ